MRFPLFERHPRDDLSGYLDNELTPRRSEAVKTHLSSCPTCHAEIEALRALKSELSALPESQAPRSFGLTLAMAQLPASGPARARTPTRVAALSNGMRLAGAGMAVALAVVMVLNFSGSGSDSGSHDDSTAAREFLTTSANYADSATTSTDSALAVPSVAASGAAENAANTAVPPEVTTAPGGAGVGGGPGSGGGVGSPPSSGGGVGSGPVPGTLPTATPTFVPGTTTRATSAPGVGGAVVPSASPAATDLDVQSIAGDGRTDTTGDVNKDVATGQPTNELARTGGTEPDDGGVDILLLVAIALAAGVVLTFAGSVLLPRFVRDDE